MAKINLSNFFFGKNDVYKILLIRFIVRFLKKINKNIEKIFGCSKQMAYICNRKNEMNVLKKTTFSNKMPR